MATVVLADAGRAFGRDDGDARASGAELLRSLDVRPGPFGTGSIRR